MLHNLIVEELTFIQLYDIENILSLLELPALFQILHSPARFVQCVGLSSRNILLEDLNAFLTITHRDEKVGLERFTLARHTENKLLHLLEQLLV